VVSVDRLAVTSWVVGDAIAGWRSALKDPCIEAILALLRTLKAAVVQRAVADPELVVALVMCGDADGEFHNFAGGVGTRDISRY